MKNITTDNLTVNSHSDATSRAQYATPTIDVINIDDIGDFCTKSTDGPWPTSSASGVLSNPGE